MASKGTNVVAIVIAFSQNHAVLEHGFQQADGFIGCMAICGILLIQQLFLIVSVSLSIDGCFILASCLKKTCQSNLQYFQWLFFVLNSTKIRLIAEDDFLIKFWIFYLVWSYGLSSSTN